MNGGSEPLENPKRGEKWGSGFPYGGVPKVWQVWEWGAKGRKVCLHPLWFLLLPFFKLSTVLSYFVLLFEASLEGPGVSARPGLSHGSRR